MPRDVIDALMAGLEFKRARRQEAEAAEDRDVEKKILQHRLREIKLGDELQKRQFAVQNLQALTGLPEANIPQNMLDYGMSEEVSTQFPPEMQIPTEVPVRQFKPIDIPGSEELGVPGFSVRPTTMEQGLERELAVMRAKALMTPHVIPRGGNLVVGGEVVAKGQPVPEPYRAPVPYTTRDAQGRETTVYVPPEQRTTMPPAVKEPLPARPSAAYQFSTEEVERIADEVETGSQEPDLPKTTLGYRVRDALAKRGYNLSKALTEWNATQRFWGAQNEATQSEIRRVATETEQALMDLESLSGQWQGPGFPLISAANISLATRGGLGPEKQKLAADIGGASLAVANGLQKLSAGGGDTEANKALQEVSATLGGNWDNASFRSAMAKAKGFLGYRVNAIRNLKPAVPGAVMPGTAPPPGGTAPPPAANANVPPEVTRQFSTGPPRIITFRNGQVWEKRPDGTIIRR
jgi:hypothetical protein